MIAPTLIVSVPLAGRVAPTGFAFGKPEDGLRAEWGWL
jgi:hypothetical protein